MDAEPDPKISGSSSSLKAVGLVVLALGLLLGLAGFLLSGPSDKELETIRRALDDGQLLLDVRTPGEFASGHLEGARNIPIGDLEARLRELGAKDKPLVVY